MAADTEIAGLGLTAFQTILLVFLIFGCLQYIWLIWEDKYASKPSGLKEGFTGTGALPESERTKALWYENHELFDDFYASVYDNLTQLAGRYPQEVALIINQWKKKAEPDTMEILDCGCGTGIASVYFAKFGVKSVTGLDKSESMLRRARNVTLPATKLTEEKRDTVTFLNGDLNQQMTFSPGQFSHAAMLFFTFYYLNDPTGIFRNLYHWVRPGGHLAIEVVNKYKFDPMLESANPFFGVSMQKYAKKRQTKSKVEFDKFSYEAEFDLQDPQAEFRETFRFKDNSVRRQRHTMNMRDINDIIHIAQTTGWNYDGYIDLMSVGFEYAYVLMFTHG